MPHMKLTPWAQKKIWELDERLREGLISPHKYDQICEQIMSQDKKTGDLASPKARRKRRLVSDSSLSSHLGKQPAFPVGARSDRIRGRTAYLAKKVHLPEGAMSGKMNWDRVRSENRAHLQGAEHIDAASRVLTSTGKLTPPTRSSKKYKVKRKKNASSRSVRPMPGCTCGKPVGFSGLHRKQCPLSNPLGQITVAAKAATSPTKTATEGEKWLRSHPPQGRPYPTIKELAVAIRAVGRQKAVRDALSAQIGDAVDTPRESERLSKVAARIIAAMLKELQD